MAAQPLPIESLHFGPRPFLSERERALSGLRWEHFEARRLAPTIGAELSGVDLRDPSPTVLEEIERAFHAYRVLFFRDQPLAPEQHLAFARHFGELEEHPFIQSRDGYGQIIQFERTSRRAASRTTGTPTSRGAKSLAGLGAARGGGARRRRRHALRRHGARLPRPERRDEGTHRGPGRRPRLHARLRPRARRSGARGEAQGVPRGAPSAGPHPPGDRREDPLRQPDLHHPHRGPPGRREQRPARDPVPAGRGARVPVPLPLGEGQHRLLGQPRGPPLRRIRLLAQAPRDGARHDHRRAALLRSRAAASSRPDAAPSE